MILLYARKSPCHFYFIPSVIATAYGNYVALEFAWLNRAIGIGAMTK